MPSTKPKPPDHCLLVIALAAEAAPLVSHFKCRSHTNSTFKTWSSENVTLVVSGMGKVKAAAATAATLALLPQPTPCLNVGIAGGGRNIGEMVQGQRIEDQATGQTWYPPILGSSALPRVTIKTVDRVSNDYRDNIAVEMEASGFFQSAIMFQTSELVQCLKVISDNDTNPLDAHSPPPTPSFISGLIEQHTAEIVNTLDSLRQLVLQLPDNRLIEQTLHELQEKLHFSVTQQHTTKRLLQRTLSLNGCLPDTVEMQNSSSAKSLIAALQESLQKKAITY